MRDKRRRGMDFAVDFSSDTKRGVLMGWSEQLEQRMREGCVSVSLHSKAKGVRTIVVSPSLDDANISRPREGGVSERVRRE